LHVILQLGRKVRGLVISPTVLVALVVIAAACSSGNVDTTVPGTDGGESTLSTEPATSEGTTGETSPSTTEVSAVDRIVGGQAYRFTSFDPYFTASENRAIHFQVFDPIIHLDRDGTYQPALATEWEMAADGSTMLLTIRSGVTFHNGREMTSDDIVANLERARDADIGHNQSTRASVLAETSVVSENQVELKFVQPIPEVAILELLRSLFVVAPENFDDVPTSPIGTGPYTLAEYSPGRGVVLSAYEAYWGDEPATPTLEVREFDDAGTLEVNFRGGDVAWAAGLGFNQVANLLDSEFVVQEEDVLGRVYALAINVTSPEFSDRRVRQAIAFAVDREKIVQNVFFGLSDPTSTPFAVEGLPLYRESDVDAYGFNLDRAAELLEEAGAQGLTFEANYSANNAESGAILEILQQDLATIGVTMEIQPLEAAEAREKRLAGDFTVFSTTAGAAPGDPGTPFVGNAQYRADDNNAASFRDPEYQRIASEAAVEIDSERRLALYEQLREIILEEQFVVSVATGKVFYVRSPNLTGLEVAPLDFPMLSSMELEG
jgi:peptide/nickel transport system substrate-binding protein